MQLSSDEAFDVRHHGKLPLTDNRNIFRSKVQNHEFAMRKE